MVSAMDERQRKRRLASIVAALAIAAVIVVTVALRLRPEVDVGLTVPNGTGEENGNVSADQVAAVVYEFHDASVAPEYHRSFTVTVREGQAQVVVYTYDETLHDVTEPIDGALWQRTVDTALGFAGAESVPNNGCTGGTSDDLIVLGADDEPLFEVSIDNCDGGGANVSAAVGEVLPLFDMDTFLATG